MAALRTDGFLVALPDGGQGNAVCAQNVARGSHAILATGPTCEPGGNRSTFAHKKALIQGTGSRCSAASSSFAKTVCGFWCKTCRNDVTVPPALCPTISLPRRE